MDLAQEMMASLIPRRICGPDEVRLKVAYCGLCGTDVHEYLSGPVLLPSKTSPNRYTGAGLPIIMGHEFSGNIIELGANVQGLSVGQKIAVNPAMGCHHHGLALCELCQSGRRNICTRSTFYGLSAKGGGLADEICVKPVAVVPLPDQVSLKLAALAEPLSVAAHMVRISGFTKGQNVVVFGSGPIGCALTLILKDQGAGCIIVSEVAKSRAAHAVACGADRVVNPTTRPSAVLDAAFELMNPGADIAFDACGLQTTLDDAFKCTKPGETILNVAIGDKPLKLEMNLLTLSEKRLLAGNAYTEEDFGYVMRLLARRGDTIEKFISRVVPLNMAVDGGFAELVRNKAEHNKILVQVHGESE